MYHKIQKMVVTYKFSTWEKAKNELYLLPMAITLVPMGPRRAPSIIKEPMIVPTPGGQRTAPPQRGIHYYILHIILSIHWSPKEL